ncbi:hypothetical protein [Mucilaginibacter paludis]|uniref:Uncharacterized protein n=1 Tax=Mucilaginibacter paludis DSM 18603 TaxID=714943 RepID=H1YF06_9SPHI|nr:hypothetical protein [Mucilaginibacter paludis]EHQ25259.1 hypothetical protein Mucpa_1089 [Mucilaginibacter paludis DSM 18603]
MTETFTTILNSINNFEMKEQEGIEALGLEETTFYNSIRADLDRLETAPKIFTIQSILNHSLNYVR